MGTLRPMHIETLDHVALWVGDRDWLADFLTSHTGMHVVDRTERFTLVGSDARRGKLTFFAEEGPRDPGVLARIGLRVLDLEDALAALPSDLAVERRLVLAPALCFWQTRVANHSAEETGVAL